MVKAILFVLGCGLASLLVEFVIISIISSLIKGNQVEPQFYLAAFGCGVAEGVILACANALGKWPRLAWRRIFRLNASLKIGIIAMSGAAALNQMKLERSSLSYHYVYFSPEPGAWIWPSLFAAPVAVWVLVLRWRVAKSLL